jgi:2-C-methyl-D-erythritol 2,4-cyclodiphosphate synthase
MGPGIVTLRIGHGLDVHRFTAGRSLMLGCVPIAAERGLGGHSDGDAAAHALADACLGAAGLGTMGDHFPSSDERWRGTSGREFLELVAAALAAVEARVLSAQVVLVCAEPRLAPSFQAMATAMSEALGLPGGTVSVGATSGDGLGAVGRGDGVLASAVVLLDLGSAARFGADHG